MIFAGFDFTKDGALDVARTLDFCAVSARTLECDLSTLANRLMAADGRVDALTTPDHLAQASRNIAIREGVASGKVEDMRAVFTKDQDWNAERRARESAAGQHDDGSAA